jgi:hypothetical protein
MPFYINIIFDRRLDELPAITGVGDLGKLAAGLAGNLATLLANSPSMADGMVENLEVAVPQHFEETGITLRLVRRYMVDALVVMLVIIDRTDMDKLSAYSSQRGYKAGASCLRCLSGCNRACSCCEGCMGSTANSLVETVIRANIKKAICDGWLRQQGVKAEVLVLHPEEEPAFLFNQLAAMKSSGAGPFMPTEEGAGKQKRTCCF